MDLGDPARDGHAQSVFDLPLADSRRRVIEYHTEVTDRPGEFVSYWRELTTIGPDETQTP